MAEFTAARPASTILLLRDGAQKEIEVFMMVRHHEIEFSSGALVFPGGSVDAADRDVIARPEFYTGSEGHDADDLSFRIAAIRETFEESGILLARPRGSTTLVDAKRAADIATRHRLALTERKITFLDVLAESGTVLALDELVPYARWITPEAMPKRYDTWFFLAAAPPDQLGAHDGREFDRLALAVGARSGRGRRERAFQAAVSDHAQSDQAWQAAEREGSDRGCAGKAHRRGAARTDAAGRSTPASHSA